jgi:hypothetical protein
MYFHRYRKIASLLYIQYMADTSNGGMNSCATISIKQLNTMKLSNLKPATKPFIKTDKLSIFTIEESGEVTAYRITVLGKTKTFQCNGKPDEAWKKMEKFVGNKL